VRLFLFCVLISTTSCLRAWEVGGPWACDKDEVCPTDFTCDDGICCVPGGTPACPTLPFKGHCAEGELKVYFQDVDGDGDGNEKVSESRCRQPRTVPNQPAWVLTGGDCDDTRADIFTGAPELCNGKDDNCDQRIDENLPNPKKFYRDEDGDGVGETAALLEACMAPPGYSALSGDCAPLDPTKFPGANERCNNLDDDCDQMPDTAETTFMDTDGPGSTRFPCLVENAQGVCRAGTFQCEVQGTQVQRVCRSLNTSSREVCDGLDNDCTGGVDEAPKCGGPRNFLNAPLVLYRAERLTSGAQLTTTCQANLPGTAETVSSDGRTWHGLTAGYHVWSVQAPPGTLWDLSRLDAQLHLAFAATGVAVAGAGGKWGAPGPPDFAPYNPVVYLCGETDTDFMRYRIVQPTDAFRIDDASFDKVLPLNNSSSTWLVGIGSGFDTSRVKRIEVLVFTLSTDFTITFDNATGMGP
jgi:hypothetical protein